jgi:hypothetical protein
VQLDVFDLSGRRVARLLDTQLSGGRHRVEWDGRTGGGIPAASGVYILRLSAGRHRAARQMLLLR